MITHILEYELDTPYKEFQPKMRLELKFRTEETMEYAHYCALYYFKNLAGWKLLGMEVKR